MNGIETRLDADASVAPDIVADMTALGDIGTFDAVYCCHALEHLIPRDVLVALGEFRRVLKDGGAAIVVVPDLEGVRPTFDVLYDSPAGPITGHDMYYGHAGMVEANPYMQHKTGFVAETLRAAFLQAGFAHCDVKRITHYNLLGVAVK